MAIPEAITSRDNQRLINARKVRDGGVRELIFVEGKRLVGEAVSADLKIEECFVAEGFDDRVLVESVGTNAPVFELSDRLFKTIADTASPQGIIAIARRPTTDFDQTTVGSLVVFLQDVNNPANLGAVLRTAEAAGVSAVITSPGSADAFSPRSLRAAMGSAFRLRVEQGMDMAKAVAFARTREMRIVATNPESGILHTANDWTQPTLVVFGSEAHGLSAEELAMCDASVRIPLTTGVESLNLAVAAGIILFEAKRQNS
ncbi:MAG: RNA methyltransferase [Pyrinomonadaceae bacterium]